MIIPQDIFKPNRNRYLKEMPKLDKTTYELHARVIYALGLKLEPNLVLNPTKEQLHHLTSLVNDLLSKQGKKAVSSDVIKGQFTKLKGIYRDLMFYFRGSDETSLDLDKSLFLYGATGCGKTLAMSIFKEYTMNVLKQNSFQVKSSSEIITTANRLGLDSIDRYVRTESNKPISIYIEDFGAGNQVVKNFGTDINVMDELIGRRYRDFQEHGTLTHICSNIKPDDLKSNFDTRIESRLSDMCNFINFNSLDYRKI